MAPTSSAPPGPSLLFAARCADITPPAGSAMAGYVARGTAAALGALDPLEATIVTLRDPRPGGGTVVWVALDALAVDVALARSIAEAVGSELDTSADQVVVAASHTHAAPSGWLRGIPFAAPEPGDPEMRAELVRRIQQAARDLGAAGIPVRTALRIGIATGIGTNRTDPARPSDRSLGALAMIDGQDTVVGLVVDHASHATVLGHENRLWSADWPGAGRRALARALRHRTASGVDRSMRQSPSALDGPAGGPVVAFLQGAAGDASPRFVRRSQTPDEVRRLGELFAGQALEASLDVDRSSVDVDRVSVGEPTVAIRRETVRIPTRSQPDAATLAGRVEGTERAWHAARASGEGTPEERIARTRHEGAQIAAALAKAGLPASLELPLSVVVIGTDAWLHVPVELFSSYAVEIRGRSPFDRTRVIGYADGYFGYVADPDAYDLETYEASSSLFDLAGARTLVDASVELLRQTHDALWPRRSRA